MNIFENEPEYIDGIQTKSKYQDFAITILVIVGILVCAAILKGA